MKRFSWIIPLILVAACAPVQMPDNYERMPLANGWTAVAIHASPSWASSDAKCSTAVGASMMAERSERFNERHPELKPSEVFVTNCASEDFGRVAYKTKRGGRVAYDVYGRKVEGSIPVFVQTKEWEAVRKEKSQNRYRLHIWTRNSFFADARVTLVGAEGCVSDSRKVKKTFRLKREKSIGRSWEGQMIVPRDFCILEIVVKPKGKKAIKFLLAKKMEMQIWGKVNLLLSSQQETYTWPRLKIGSDLRWPVTYRPPVRTTHSPQSVGILHNQYQGFTQTQIR